MHGFFNLNWFLNFREKIEARIITYCFVLFLMKKFIWMYSA